MTLTRALPHSSAHVGENCVHPIEPTRVLLHQWDAGRWFVTDDVRRMIGEVEFIGSSYRVSHSADAKGAVFEFSSLCLATTYFDEYVAAESL